METPYSEMLVENGYAIIPLNCLKKLNNASSYLLEKANKILNNPLSTLSDYHNINSDLSVDEHRKIHLKMANDNNFNDIITQVLFDNKSLFYSILGPDLAISVQRNLRIVRPFQSIDAVGTHRDTDVGESPFGFTVWMPLVEFPKEASVEIYPKSHRLGKNKLVPKHYEDERVKQGSPENRIGFFYRPMTFNIDELEPSIRPHVPYGSFMIFSTAMLHGGAQNISNLTRWSVDMNLENLQSSFNWFHHGDSPKFKTLCLSPMTQIAKLYDPSLISNLW